MSFRNVPVGQGPESAPRTQLPGTKQNSAVDRVKKMMAERVRDVQAEPIPPVHPAAQRLLDASPKAPEGDPALDLKSVGQIYPSETTPLAAPAAAPVAAAEATTPAATPSQEELLSSRYAKLAREETQRRARAEAEKARLDARESDFRAREEALKAREAEYQSKYIPKDSLQGPGALSALMEAGLSYDQITEMMVAQQNGSANPIYDHKIKSLETVIKNLESRLNETSKSFEDNEKSQYDQAVNQIKYDVRKAVRGNADFETIEKTNSYNDVVDLIEKTFKEGLGDEYPKGTILDVYEAANMVEKEISEDLFKYATSVSKIQKRLQPVATATATAPQTQEKPQERQLTTLTNNVGTSRKLSARERAIARVKGQTI